jgi:hypothetical protein
VSNSSRDHELSDVDHDGIWAEPKPEEVNELVRAAVWVLRVGDPELPEQMALADALRPFVGIPF